MAEVKLEVQDGILGQKTKRTNNVLEAFECLIKLLLMLKNFTKEENTDLIDLVEK